MAAIWLWALTARAQVVDRLTAVVGGSTVVTESDVALERSLAPLDAEELPFWRHGEPEERMIDAALLRAAAADVALYLPTTEAIRARTATIRGAFATDADWQQWSTQWGLDEAAMTVLIRRRLVVERYLERNLTADAADDAAWMAEAHRMIAQLATRIQVRRIAPAAP